MLLIGIISGTYSSIAIASQVLVDWEHHDSGTVHSSLPGASRPSPPIPASGRHTLFSTPAGGLIAGSGSSGRSR
ncbi:MAG TPA: hypothetical protein VIO16_12030 [Dehalococcoidia bacterium]